MTNNNSNNILKKLLLFLLFLFFLYLLLILLGNIYRDKLEALINDIELFEKLYPHRNYVDDFIEAFEYWLRKKLFPEIIVRMKNEKQNYFLFNLSSLLILFFFLNNKLFN